MQDPLVAIRWTGSELQLLDQQRLPHARMWVACRTWQDVAAAIGAMVVRGAPAIAISAAYGLALAVQTGSDRTVASAGLLRARPTAVNLRWALERMAPVPDHAVVAEAVALHAEDLRTNRALGDAGADLLHGGVLTICNTGTLATGGHGTALGVVRSARARGNDVHVFALETRPYLQGARLTAFECIADGIPCTLITDGMAAAAMQSGRVTSVIVGCDRVAHNGDAANKIGTLQTAILARHFGVPFYVAMPMSTLDPRCETGADIEIETRPAEEVRSLGGVAIAPGEVDVWNPAFDVTPAQLITGWVTEHGLWRPPGPTE